MTKRELVEHIAFTLRPLLRTAIQSGCTQEAAVELVAVMAKVLALGAVGELELQSLNAESTPC